MTLTLQRIIETRDGTFGRLILPGHESWYTVERRHDVEHPRIPAGTYPLHRDMFYGGDGVGGKIDYPAYELNVPGRAEIKIHVANEAEQLHGCIALGTALGFLDGQLAVLHSKDALAAFMAAYVVQQDYIVVLDEMRL